MKQFKQKSWYLPQGINASVKLLPALTYYKQLSGKCLPANNKTIDLTSILFTILLFFSMSVPGRWHGVFELVPDPLFGGEHFNLIGGFYLLSRIHSHTPYGHEFVLEAGHAHVCPAHVHVWHLFPLIATYVVPTK